MQPVGQSPVIKKAQKLAAAPTAALEKFIVATEEIRQAPLDGEPAFSPRQLVQCTLPHSNPGDVPVWSRQNGNFTLSIVPGVDLKTGKSYGYPYGALPRLLVFWLTREVLRIKSRRINLSGKTRDGKESNSLSAFMRALGLIPASAGGGERSDATRLKEQMRRLFQSSISFQWNGIVDGMEGEAWLKMPIAPKGEMWWDLKRPDQGSLWNSWIELGEDFYKALMEAPVPVDMRALKALNTGENDSFDEAPQILIFHSSPYVMRDAARAIPKLQLLCDCPAMTSLLIYGGLWYPKWCANSSSLRVEN